MAVGCSSDDEAGTGVNVDPGGTYGAEIHVSVKGRGRVAASLPGLDCPSRCFARYVWNDVASAGGASSLNLTATPTPGSRFTGWSFDIVKVGARGRGSAECNPVVRDTTAPAADPAAPQLTLPFGEVQGAPPAGTEGACGGATTVPVAYALTANFETPVIVDAGPDGGAGELVFEAPSAGAVAKDIGIASGRLYWTFQVGGLTGIASGIAGSTTTPTVVVQPTSTMGLFEVDAHVAYQTGAGTLGVMANGSTFPTTLGGAPTCEALATDASSVFCLTAAGTLESWTVAGAGPTTLFTGLPVSSDKFAVDSTSVYLVDDPGAANAAMIKSAQRSSADGGATALTTLVTGQTNPIRLEVNSSRLFWVNYEPTSIVGQLLSASRLGGSATTSVQATNGLRMLALDPSSSLTVYAGVVTASGGDILRASSSGTTPTPVVQGITGLGGIAVDSSYVYWTQRDGRVYRHPKL